MDEIAYIGDDLIDLPVLSIVGLRFAPNNAVNDVKKAWIMSAILVVVVVYYVKLLRLCLKRKINMTVFSAIFGIVN